MTKKTSNAINFLGKPLILESFQKVIDEFPNLQNNIISIGSGGGYIEKLLSDLLAINIIGIDPDPTSFIEDKTIYLEPKYPYIDDLIKENPNIIENCILFINWSNPDEDYDIQSILKLNPTCIIIVNETGISGAAGSIGLHQFLDINNIKTLALYNEFNELINIRELFDKNLCNIHYFCNVKCECKYLLNGYNPVECNFGLYILSRRDIKFSLPSKVTPYGFHTNMIENGSEWIKIRLKWDKIINKYIDKPVFYSELSPDLYVDHEYISENKKLVEEDLLYIEDEIKRKELSEKIVIFLDGTDEEKENEMNKIYSEINDINNFETIIKFCFSNSTVNMYIDEKLYYKYKNYKLYGICDIINLFNKCKRTNNLEYFKLLKHLVKPYYLEYKLNKNSLLNKDYNNDQIRLYGLEYLKKLIIRFDKNNIIKN